LSLNYPGEGGLEELGRTISGSAGHVGQKVAFLASGDMSHRLRPGAPAGYHPAAEGFDRQFMEWIRAGSYQSLSQCDPDLQDLAAEDVVDSTRVAAAAVEWKADGHEVLSYEGPFGVGYGVAVLYDSRAKPADAVESDPKHWSSTNPFLVLPRIARESVEAALIGGELAPLEPEHETLKHPCAVFVTIREYTGDLRGCVGTLNPKYGNIVEETRHMANEAAFGDHRFSPVRPEEISRLHFEVSVLGPLQEASLDDLDPKRYGVVVTAEDGRRGALLPDIPEVQTVDEQIRIARKKAGIASWEFTKIMRFETKKYAEPDSGSAIG
jgi:AmmeMemoRadiSam system protein A